LDFILVTRRINKEIINSMLGLLLLIASGVLSIVAVLLIIYYFQE